MNQVEQDAYNKALRKIEERQRSGGTYLDLSGMGLTHLPPEIGQLTALTELHLGANQLATLPPEIGQLTALTVLFLHSNQLASLPPEIGQLTALTELYLDSNQLASLPPEIGQLTALAALSLGSNQLASLSPEMSQLSALTRLYLHGNPKLGLLPPILGPDPRKNPILGSFPSARSILDFYFDLLEQGNAPMQEVRLLLVGRGRVGKTSLLKVLQGKSLDLEEKETPGISVEPMRLACDQGEATAHVWDFGEQEFLHGTHQIFLSDRCVYVLVLQGRESNWESETDYWLRFIESFGGDSPVIVALNKYDEHPFSVDRHRLLERCPQIAGFVPTDALTGLGIEDLRSLLKHTVNGMKDVWEGVPRNWHRVKQDLEKMNTSFLTYEAYQARCRELGVVDEGKQDSLAQTLHRLGIALNFRDHHRLRNTSVLKPEWVTEAVYGLIRHTQKSDCHGLLTEKCLVDALQPPESYPREMHGFVVNLMEKFEVAFLLDETPEDGRIWLIPELLGEEQPDAFLQFRGKAAQRLRFTYPAALPPGLLPRLIVRTREMSRSHPEWRWRGGVVLVWGECQALVRLDRSARQTEVVVIGGKLEDQQSLFDIVRAHLIELHGKVSANEETEISGHPGKWINVGKLRHEERKETTVIDDFIDNTEVKVEVSKELDQVESDAATEASGPDPQRRVHLFISYAHVNEEELIPFRQHLTLLSQRGYIQVWHDRNLIAGEKWETGIMAELNRAEIVLLFYTTGARTSQFIRGKELPISLDRADKGECAVLWVPLERNDLLMSDTLEKRLSEVTCSTVDKKIIYNFNPHQVGWMQVEESIRKAVEKRRLLTQDSRGLSGLARLIEGITPSDVHKTT